MAYVTPSVQATGVLVTASIWNQDVVNNMIHLAGMKSGGTALSALAAGTHLSAPAYDSGWYSVAVDTTYTKAHGLGVTPRHVEVFHSTTATPGSSDELVRVTGVSESYGKDVVGVDATNVYVTTGVNTYSYATVNSRRRDSNTGYHKVMAWV